MGQSFAEFLGRRETASNDYIAGDPAALRAMMTEADPATFMPPNGAVVQGAQDVAQAQVGGAAAFGPASTGRFEVLGSGSSSDLAYWTGLQVATMDIRGQDDPVETVLRVTEVFRLADGDWRLVHRHADPAPLPDGAQ